MHPQKEIVFFSVSKSNIILGAMVEEQQLSTKDKKDRKKYMGGAQGSAGFDCHVKEYVASPSEKVDDYKHGAPGWLSGLKPLPLAQVMIPGSWD